MLCTNCASPAFCKFIACFHIPLIKKKKKQSRKIYFANPSLTATQADGQGCELKQADLFCTWAMSLVGCEDLDMDCGSGNGAHIVLPCLVLRDHHVPADGGERHCLSGRSGWDHTGRSAQNGVEYQLLAVGVAVSSWGGR